MRRTSDFTRAIRKKERKRMLLKISHETRLTYSQDVSGTIFEARMAPRSDDDQTAYHYAISTNPGAPITSFRDGDGNRIDLFNIFEPYRRLSVSATSYVRTHRRDVQARMAGVVVGAGITEGMGLDLVEQLKPSPLVANGPLLTGLARSLAWPDSEPAADRAKRIMDAIDSRLSYESDVTHAWSSVEEVLELNRGVCQDFAHVLIGLARLKGLPARYVSGYIHQTGQIATHAWAQVWFGPAVGWVDLDPTRGAFATDDHITVAYGRDYSDVPPNRGLWAGQADESIEVVVEISPVDRLPTNSMDFVPRKSVPSAYRDRYTLGSKLRSQTPVAEELRGSLASQPFQPTSHPQQTQQQQTRRD
jgi:transglutaminase-like putative cysteine protease